MSDSDQTINVVSTNPSAPPPSAGSLGVTEKNAETPANNQDDGNKVNEEAPGNRVEVSKVQPLEVKPENGENLKSTAYHVILKKDRDPEAKWYVVHTYSGHEENIATQLKIRIKALGLTNLVHEALVPTQDKIKILRGKKQTVKEKIFPGYILVRLKLNDASWLAVRNTPGITGFVGIGKNPSPIPETEVDTIRKFAAQKAPKFVTAFSVGEAVKISEGPFTEFLGTVSALDETKGKVTVLVSIFGRETPVELDFLQVAKI